MNHTKRWCAVFASVAITGLLGCTPELTMDDLKAMKPQRPAELDKLDAFAGEWESTAEMKITGLDEVIAGRGEGTTTWECDGWVLVERGEFEMGELGKMYGIGIYTWDPKAKVYRTWWFDSYGSRAAGKIRYDESKNRWRIKARSRGAWGDQVSEGTIDFVDENTMEWTWTEWDGLKLFKTVEMTGTSKRK